MPGDQADLKKITPAIFYLLTLRQQKIFYFKDVEMANFVLNGPRSPVDMTIKGLKFDKGRHKQKYKNQTIPGADNKAFNPSCSKSICPIFSSDQPGLSR